MAYEKKPVVRKWDNNPWDRDPWDLNPGNFDTREPSFETMLNIACERLWDKHVKYSIRRIREMDEELEKLEKELDEFIEPMVRGRSHAKT